jgi:beta-glucanase (GH16 family)
MTMTNGLARGVFALGLLSLASAACAAQDAAEQESSSGSDWRLVWSDEFDGDAIDPARWTLEQDCWGGGNAERQCYTAFEQNARIEDGHLVIEARLGEAQGPALPAHMRANATEEERRATNTQPFTSARLNTREKGDWTYGRIEVRARLPEGQGTWPAIWMLPTDEYYGGWAASGEIDILEAVNLGEPCRECRGDVENRIFGTLHYGGEWPQNTYQNRETTLPASADGEQDFHVFAVEWTEGRIEWFLDGESYGYLTQRRWRSASEAARGRPYAPFDQRFHLILNLAVGGHLAEGRNVGGVRVEAFPQQFLIDWVRVYDCPQDLETAQACAN